MKLFGENTFPRFLTTLFLGFQFAVVCFIALFLFSDFNNILYNRFLSDTEKEQAGASGIVDDRISLAMHHIHAISMSDSVLGAIRLDMKTELDEILISFNKEIRGNGMKIYVRDSSGAFYPEISAAHRQALEQYEDRNQLHAAGSTFFDSVDGSLCAVLSRPILLKDNDMQEYPTTAFLCYNPVEDKPLWKRMRALVNGNLYYFDGRVLINLSNGKFEELPQEAASLDYDIYTHTFGNLPETLFLPIRSFQKVYYSSDTARLRSARISFQRKMLTMSGCILSLTIFFCVWAGKMLARPLKRMARETDGVISGNNGKVYFQENTGLAEVRLLAQSVNNALKTQQSVSADLAESNKRFKEISDLSPAVISEMTADLRIIYFNEAGFKAFGYTKEEVETGLDFEEIVHPSDKKEIIERLRDIVRRESDESIKGDFRIFTKYGAVLDCLFLGRSIFRDGTLQGIRFALTDISKIRQAEAKVKRLNDDLESRVKERTSEIQEANNRLKVEIIERRKAEAQIRSANSNLQNILDSLPVGLAMVGTDENLRHVNRMALEMTGFRSSDDLVGFNCRKSICPQAPERCPVLVSGEASLCKETFIRRNDGEMIPVLKNVIPIENNNEKMLLETFLDISVIKQTQASMKIRDMQLELIVEHSPGAVAMFDSDMHYLIANKKWLSLFKLPESISDKTLFEDFPDGMSNWQVIFRRCLSLGKEDRCDEDLVELPGQGKEWVEWSVHPWRNAEGKTGGLIVFIENISDRKWAEDLLWQAKQQAEAANRMKSEFLSDVSHEVRTPLNSVIGFAELIIGSRNHGEAQKEAGQILSEAESLQHLIDDLMDHQLIEAGNLQLDSQDFALRDILNELTPGIERGISLKNLTFSIRYSENLPEFVHGDASRLRQVLISLVGNAVKFTESGSITVRAILENEFSNDLQVRFEVEDTGIGMSKETQDSLFQNDTGVDAEHAEKRICGGLGTSVAQRLVRMMNGDIGVKTDSGKGSLFHFSVLLGKVGETKVKSKIVPKLKNAAILLVDGNDMNRVVAETHLKRAGCKVEHAVDGKQALEACRHADYDLILMDIQMPEMNGFDSAALIRRIGGRFAEIPIVALTANAESGYTKDFASSGIDGIILKPIRKQTFIATVAEALGRENLSGGKDCDKGPAEFAVRTVSYINDLRKAAENHDFILLEEMAHLLAGESMKVGLNELADRAAELNKLALGGEMSQLEDTIEELNKLLKKFIAEKGINLSN